MGAYKPKNPDRITPRKAIRLVLERNPEGLTARKIVKLVMAEIRTQPDTIESALHAMRREKLITNRGRYRCECCDSSFCVYKLPG